MGGRWIGHTEKAASLLLSSRMPTTGYKCGRGKRG